MKDIWNWKKYESSKKASMKALLKNGKSLNFVEFILVAFSILQFCLKWFRDDAR